MIDQLSETMKKLVKNSEHLPDNTNKSHITTDIKSEFQPINGGIG